MVCVCVCVSSSSTVFLLVSHYLAFQYFATEWYPFQEVHILLYIPNRLALIYTLYTVKFPNNVHVRTRPFVVLSSEVKMY